MPREGALRKAYELGELRHAFAHSRFGPTQVPRHEAYVVDRRQVREEPPVLHDVTHLGPGLPEIFSAERHLPEQHLTGVGPEEAEHEPQGRRLAAPARSEQDGRPRGRYVEARLVERRHIAEALAGRHELHDGR